MACYSSGDRAARIGIIISTFIQFSRPHIPQTSVAASIAWQRLLFDWLSPRFSFEAIKSEEKHICNPTSLGTAPMLSRGFISVPRFSFAPSSRSWLNIRCRNLTAGHASPLRVNRPDAVENKSSWRAGLLKNGSELQLVGEDGFSATVHPLWLRERTEDPALVHLESSQRMFEVAEVSKIDTPHHTMSCSLF